MTQMLHDELLNKEISPLVESMFPGYYREHGPIFVAFVKKYFEWMEGQSQIANTSFNFKGKATVTSGNTVIQGRGTDFTNFSNGDVIALYRENSPSYDLFEINAVSNATYLTVNALPSFSSTNSIIKTVKTQKNPYYLGRRVLDYHDVDITVDDFLLFFKEKYLKNIQFDTTTNTRLLLKKALDIYRSKGTERSLDLLFRIVFGKPASIYYPGDDILRLSDGEWHRPTYLEIALSDYAEQLVNKQIVGSDSGATAFVDALVRKTVKGRFVDILYISSLSGNFRTNELINSSDGVLLPSEKPMVIGSLSEIEIDSSGTGANFEVGDIVDIISDFGEQGKGRITETANLAGTVTFTLEDGGYGYTANAEIVVSENILQIANVQIDANNDLSEYFYSFETLYQPLANIEFISANGTFANDTPIYSYHANGDLKGTGQIMSVSHANSSTGNMLVSIRSGNLNVSQIFSPANAIVANVSTYTNKTATGNVVGYTANATLGVISVSGTFEDGEEIYQFLDSGLEGANAVLESFTTTTGSNGNIVTSNLEGVFRKNKLIIGRTSGATGNLQHVTLKVGVFTVSNSFINSTNNYVYGGLSNSNGTILTISAGSGANVAISNSLLYEENVTLNTDLLSDYLSVPLAAATYGFPGNPSANLTHGTILDALTFDTFTVGRVSRLTNINIGSGYSEPPIIRIYEPFTFPYDFRDVILTLTGTDGTFQEGELVTQSATGARGLVKSANSTVLSLQNLRFNPSNNFIVTSNSTTTILGELSAATANVSVVTTDFDSPVIGYNAVIEGDTAVSNGSVVSMEIFDSGFGYIHDEIISFYHQEDDGTYIGGTGFAVLAYQGRGEGYYREIGGFLSDQKKLFDGIYYQNYSYEVRSSVSLKKYEEMLKQLLHVAGTKYFGALVHASVSNTYISTSPTVISLS